MAFLIGGTACLIPQIGREFMPELEEGNLWLRAVGPLNMSLEHNVGIAKETRVILAGYPEVNSVITQSGRPDDGTDTSGYENIEIFVPLRQQEDWPKVMDATGWRRWIWGPKRARTKPELIAAMSAQLSHSIPGIDWNFSQNIRDNVMEALSGIKGNNSLKIFGPDLDQLELLAEKADDILKSIPGIADVGVIHVQGLSHLEFRVDPEKCQRWGVATADVNNVVTTALAAQPVSTMVEGEKRFDISIQWPKWRRDNETSILDIPVDIINNQVVLAQGPGFTPNAFGSASPPPSKTGSLADTSNPMSNTPRIRLGDLVSPVSSNYETDPKGRYTRPGYSTIYREQSKDRSGRFIAVKFSVRGRDLGSAVAEAKAGHQGSLQVSLYGDMEWRIRTDGRSQWSTSLDHSLIPRLDLGSALLRVPFVSRYARDFQQCIRRVRGRHLGPLLDGNEFQRGSSRRIRLAFRDRHHGGTAAHLLFQCVAFPGTGIARCHHSGLAQTGAAGHDYCDDSDPRPSAGSLIDEDWESNGAALGDRGGRRDDGDAFP